MAGAARFFDDQGMHTRLPMLIAAALLALALAAIAPRPAAAATAPPVRTALLYRINEVRVGHGLRPVYPSLRLQHRPRRTTPTT